MGHQARTQAWPCVCFLRSDTLVPRDWRDGFDHAASVSHAQQVANEAVVDSRRLWCLGHVSVQLVLRTCSHSREVWSCTWSDFSDSYSYSGDIGRFAPFVMMLDQPPVGVPHSSMSSTPANTKRTAISEIAAMREDWGASR